MKSIKVSNKTYRQIVAKAMIDQRSFTRTLDIIVKEHSDEVAQRRKCKTKKEE